MHTHAECLGRVCRVCPCVACVCMCACMCVCVCVCVCVCMQAVLTVVQDHTHTLSQCLTDTHTDHTTTATDVSRVLDQQTNNTQSLAQLTTLTEPVSSLGAHTVLEAAAATQQQQYNHKQQQGTGGGSFSFALLPEAARQLSVGDQPFPLRPAATTAAAAAEQPDWQAAAAAAAVSAGSGGQLALQGQVSAFLAAVANALKNVSAVTIQHGVTSLPGECDSTHTHTHTHTHTYSHSLRLSQCHASPDICPHSRMCVCVLCVCVCVCVYTGLLQDLFTLSLNELTFYEDEDMQGVCVCVCVC